MMPTTSVNCIGTTIINVSMLNSAAVILKLLSSQKKGNFKLAAMISIVGVSLFERFRAEEERRF